jgi:iron only hydrogenase large subunit-like protein/nitrogen-specific signal transduction histidine kinase
MNHPKPIPLVTTIKERCRVCYTCVRECPAKAIRIATGQAEVIPERCIGCGNCVRVCSQHAKQVLSESETVRTLLADGGPVAALVAPSFPAEFTECDERQLVGMLRAMGFEYVSEVAFGADLVADRYARLMASGGQRYIATTCPGVIGYVEKYFPDLVGSLAPIVSPMVATARALREIHGPALRTVFIGPCIAKKGEAASRRLAGEVSAALTFTELREMLAAQGLAPDAATPSDFDPPHGGRGALLPVARGLFQAAGIHENLLDGKVVAAEGRTNFVDALGEFDTGALDARLLEVLCCHGCIMGAGMSTTLPQFARRSKISRHVQQRMAQVDEAAWQADVARFKDLDLSRTFGPNDQRVAVPMPDEMAEIMARMGKTKPEDELNCGACGYETCHAHAVAIAKGLAESEMCLPHTIDQLKHAVQDLAVSNDQLATAQEALMQSEKLASMGQLAAGIAHEVNNPLGVVLMYSHLLLEECDKNSRLYEDLSMIVDQSDRCKKIVAGLLHFARQNKVLLQPSDLGDLVERSLRSLPAPDGVTVHMEHALDDRSAEVDRDQIIQVLTNLVSNAYAAMPQGGVLTVRTGGDADEVRLAVSDTGVGIPRENLAKIFEPFFTTKQIGKGTGLGLAVTYGIVKMHRGDIRVESNADPAAGPTGSTFTVTLPRKGRVS